MIEKKKHFTERELMKNENNNNEKVETGNGWKVQKDQNGVHRKWGTPFSSLQCQCKVSMIIQAIFYPPTPKRLLICGNQHLLHQCDDG